MPQDIYGVAHNLQYRRDGDSAFRELVKMLVHGEGFQGRDARILVFDDKTTKLPERGQPEDYLYVQLIKDGIIGVSVVAIILILVIIFIMKKKQHTENGVFLSGSKDTNHNLPTLDQTRDLQSRRNTIIDVEGNTHIENLLYKNNSEHVFNV